MKQGIAIVVLLLGSAFVWFLGEHLSSDAIGMAVGVGFGLCAGVPALLLTLRSNNSQSADYGPYVDAGYTPRQAPAQRMLPAGDTHYHVHFHASSDVEGMEAVDLSRRYQASLPVTHRPKLLGGVVGEKHYDDESFDGYPIVVHGEREAW